MVPTRCTEFVLKGRPVVAGTEVHLAHRPGRYRIVARCSTLERTWLEVRGPLGRQIAQLHAVAMEDVTTVHRKRSG
jgi:hypothetical protein